MAGDAPTRGQLRALLPILVSMLVLFIVGLTLSFILSQRAQRAAERANQEQLQALCPVYLLLDRTYHETPPVTATGRELTHDFDVIVAKYNCLQPK